MEGGADGGNVRQGWDFASAFVFRWRAGRDRGVGLWGVNELMVIRQAADGGREDEDVSNRESGRETSGSDR